MVAKERPKGEAEVGTCACGWLYMVKRRLSYSLRPHSNIILLRKDGISDNLQTGSTGIDIGRREVEDLRLGCGLLFLWEMNFF